MPSSFLPPDSTPPSKTTVLFWLLDLTVNTPECTTGRIVQYGCTWVIDMWHSGIGGIQLEIGLIFRGYQFGTNLRYTTSPYIYAQWALPMGRLSIYNMFDLKLSHMPSIASYLSKTIQTLVRVLATDSFYLEDPSNLLLFICNFGGGRCGNLSEASRGGFNTISGRQRLDRVLLPAETCPDKTG